MSRFLTIRAERTVCAMLCAVREAATLLALRSRLVCSEKTRWATLWFFTSPIARRRSEGNRWTIIGMMSSLPTMLTFRRSTAQLSRVVWVDTLSTSAKLAHCTFLLNMNRRRIQSTYLQEDLMTRPRFECLDETLPLIDSPRHGVQSCHTKNRPH